MALLPELWAHVLELSAAECLASLSPNPKLARRRQLMPFYTRMRSYALVNRAWSEIAQRLLFQEITQPTSSPYGEGFHLDGLRRGLAYGLLDLVDILKPMHERNAKALLAVRTVHLATGYTRHDYYGPFAVIVEVLSYCARLTDIHLLVGDLETSLGLSQSEQKVIAALTELRHLTIDCVCPPPRSVLESRERGAIPLDGLVKTAAQRLERLELTNIHGWVWSSVNYVPFPRLVAAAVRECGLPADTLRLPAKAPLLHSLEVRVADRYRLSTGTADAPDASSSIRDLRVAATWGTFDAAGLPGLDRVVVLRPRSPYLDAECFVTQLDNLNASARAIELAGLGADGVPIADKLAVVSALAAACRRAPRVVLAIIHKGSGGMRIPPSVLDLFPCEVRVDELDDANALEETMRIVEELEKSRQPTT